MSTPRRRPWPTAPAYADLLGRAWDVRKLDDMLSDPKVRHVVLAAVSCALLPGKSWSPGKVYTYANTLYGRETVVALLLVLVTRYFDTEGASRLGRRPVP